MLFPICVFLLLTGWVQAVIFNDTAGLLADWDNIETEKDVTISGGLEDSLIGSTVGISDYDPFRLEQSSPVNPNSPVQTRTSTTVPHTTAASVAAAAPPTTTFFVSPSHPLKTNSDHIQNVGAAIDPRRPNLVATAGKGIIVDTMGSTSDHMAQIEGNAVFGQAQPQNRRSSFGRGDDSGEEDRVVVVTGDQGFESVGGEKHRGGHHEEDEASQRPDFPSSSSSSVTGPTSRVEQQGGGPVLAADRPPSSRSSSFWSGLFGSSADGLHLSWPIIVGLVVLSACTLTCCSVQLLCFCQRSWKKWQDSPFMLERRIRRREARVQWRAQQQLRGASKEVNIEMQPLTEHQAEDTPIVIGSAPRVLETVRDLRKDLNALSERTLVMFDKTTSLLKGHQLTANEVRTDIQELREMCECQRDRHREVVDLLRTLGLSTAESDHLRRIRSHHRLPRRLEAPTDTYSSLSSHYRRRRHELPPDTSHATLEEEGDDREAGVENPLYDFVNANAKKGFLE